jgi:hypothetical protein
MKIPVLVLRTIPEGRGQGFFSEKHLIDQAALFTAHCGTASLVDAFLSRISGLP